MDIKTFLMLERRRLLRDLQSINEQLTSMPPGRILFERNGRYWKWRQSFPGTEDPPIHLPKSDRPLAEILALKRYLTDQRNGISAQIRLIDRFLSEFRDVVHFPNALNELCPDYRRLLTPFFVKQEALRQEWVMSAPPGSPSHPEKRICPTKCGIFVRSKSEAIIADALFDHGLAFRYEAPLDLETIRIHPDFTINDDDPAQLTIWEHFGRMDSQSYTRTHNLKIPGLISAGFIPGKNLIITYEGLDSPLDVNLVELLIGYYFH